MRPEPVTLLLVRHGQTRPDEGAYYGPAAHLTELGLRQAEAVERALESRKRLSVIYASPYQRAIETAAPLSQRLGIVIDVDTRLSEIEHSPETIAAWIRGDPTPFPLWEPHHRAEEETLGEFNARVSAFFDSVAPLHVGQEVAVFAHGGIFNEAMRWATGLGATQPWLHHFEFPNASITEIQYWPTGRAPDHAPRYAAFVRLGDTSHLDGRTLF